MVFFSIKGWGIVDALSLFTVCSGTEDPYLASPNVSSTPRVGCTLIMGHLQSFYKILFVHFFFSIQSRSHFTLQIHYLDESTLYAAPTGDNVDALSSLSVQVIYCSDRATTV